MRRWVGPCSKHSNCTRDRPGMLSLMAGPNKALGTQRRPLFPAPLAAPLLAGVSALYGRGGPRPGEPAALNRAGPTVAQAWPHAPLLLLLLPSVPRLLHLCCCCCGGGRCSACRPPEPAAPFLRRRPAVRAHAEGHARACGAAAPCHVQGRLWPDAAQAAGGGGGWVPLCVCVGGGGGGGGEGGGGGTARGRSQPTACVSTHVHVPRRRTFLTGSAAAPRSRC
jgi:hypothetical protein